MTNTYLLVEDGRSTGPHSLVVLRQKAEIFVIRPDSMVLPTSPSSADAPATWTPIHSLPELHALLFPSRTRLTLGSADVAVNVSRTDTAFAATHVPTVLRDNTARQVAAEGPLLRQPPRGAYRYRRTRDYLWSAGTLNVFCAAYGLSSTFLNPYLIGLMVIGNLGILWVMFGVMDRY